MIVSRTAELARLDALFAALVRGEGGALVVHGEAGIGKTTLLAVLRAEARRGPVLAVVDDVQWVDASSRECIEYVARRAGGPLAVVLAARDPWYPLERLRLPGLPLGPIDDTAAAELLRQRAPGLAPPVAVAVAQAAAGNPLALVELPATLTARQRAGIAELEFPLVPGGRLQRAFAGRVDALGDPARQALLVAAAHAGAELPVIAAACLRAGTAARHLADAEAAGLVRLAAGRVTFAHPLIRGQVYREARAADRRAAHVALAAVLPEGDDRRAWHLAAAAVAPDEEVAAALERVGGQAMARRAYAAAGLLVADAAFRLGDWDAADAAALQTFQLAEDVGHRHMAGWALTIRTRILAAQGRCEDGRAAAATALAIAESDQISTGLRFVHGALGFLELGLDRVDAAICELEKVERLTQGSGHEEPVIVPWAPDLVEAYARQGRAGDARRVLARLERQAVCNASPVAAAAAARCRGMLDDDFEAAFAGALAFDDRRPMPFERARTLLAFGRRLHRARRRTAARQRLRAALEGFERLHADAWARQAEAELRAAGGRHRPPQDDRALTPQELRVAAAVQRGASNRDIAADLFLSPKTVEFHLRQIYRKLDVRSRTQLVAALAEKNTTSQAGPAVSPARRAGIRG